MPAAVTLTRALLPTPLGEMIAVSSDVGLCVLEFTGPKRRDRLSARLRRHFPPHEFVEATSDAIESTRAWLDAYFAGESADVSSLPLDMHGAPFELKVWRALLTIPAGETSTYGAIANTIGSAGAARAVGAANGANPIAIVVPCHRVIGSTGSLIGYGGGLDRKTWLLDHERRWRAGALF
jgi:O-6-methylguanine DNA methyltransferase